MIHRRGRRGRRGLKYEERRLENKMVDKLTGYVPERTEKTKELLEGIEKEIGKSLKLIGDATWIISGLYLDLMDITRFHKEKYVDTLGK